MVNIITPAPADWDAFVAAQTTSTSFPRAHILQLAAWGALKSAFGWTSETVALTDSGQLIGGALLLFRRLPYRLGTMAYLPLGGYEGDPTNRTDLWQAIHACARRHRAAFLKWEYGISDTPPDFTALGFRASPQTIQPPNTILIDIAGDDETILARMNQGTRRKIRQSQKNGILYKEGTRADVEIFTRMMGATGTRNEFGIHAPEYYGKAYDLFVPQYAALILAEHAGDPLAGIMVFAVGKTAWYLYGASSDVKRNLMGAYGVQWAAIQWAKARGCTTYDMWGIPDAGATQLEAEFETRSDGLWGVYGFKRGWGGQVVRSVGAWDRVYNPIIYAGYQWMLKRRASEGE
ncbi:MAG: peptidoglycan bridge formation glycyltransferase FemA/FemB family protein [Chloroflexota bacterium]|nr:peptidoglycan bridge formation glycyltransferase FemA/FemB family protein [Chloroflexota bacterium]